MGLFRASSTSDRYILLGRVVTMDRASKIFERGAVCIYHDRISAIVSDLTHVPPDFADLVPIDTQGTIYPGLIELHNHLSYNFLPLWNVPRRYSNRNQWRETEPDYNTFVALPAKIIGSNADLDYPRSIARFVECRSLLGGVTTTQGLSSSSSGDRKWYVGLTRNVEAPLDPLFPAAEGKTLDFTTAEIESKLVPALQKDRPFFYHLSEGTDNDALQRYLDLEYKNGMWAIDRDLITIHCTALRNADFPQLAEAGGMIWSPLSNLLLYGQTAAIKAAKDSGVRIALGSDWSPSGSKNLLGELKIARILSDLGGGVFNHEDLVRMVTSTPAEMLGWNKQVGSLERGMKADILILEGNVGDPYEELVQASESDLLAVIIDGRPRYGRKDLLEFDISRQELITVGGKAFCLDLTEQTISDPLAGLSLSTATTKLAYGLAHLPELAQKTISLHAMGVDLPAYQPISIDFDLDDEPADEVKLREHIATDAPNLKPLPMSPITAVDDPDWITALKNSNNLPAEVRNLL